MAALKPDRITFSIRTEVINSDFGGGLDEGVEHAFCYVSSAARRAALLAKLVRIDAQLTKHEADTAARGSASQ